MLFGFTRKLPWNARIYSTVSSNRLLALLDGRGNSWHPPTAGSNSCPTLGAAGRRWLATSKEKKRQRRQEQLQWQREQQNRRRRMRNLHPAAKMKRILSYCDEWFSSGNLDSWRRELNDYRGHVRIGALANRPQLEGWGDDPQLICQTLESQAAASRYRVVFHRGLVETVARNRQRQRQRNRQQELRQHSRELEERKERKRWRKQRMQELLAFLEKTKEEYWTPIWMEVKRELMEECQEQVEEAQIATSEPVTEMASILSRDTTHSLADTQTNFTENKDIQVDWETHYEELKWQYFDEYYETQLLEENNEFAQALMEYEDLQDEGKCSNSVRGDDDHSSRDWRITKEYDDSRDADLKGTFIDAKVEKDDMENDEELPFPIVDDGSTDYAFALVRPKKVKPEQYQHTESVIEESRRECSDDDSDDYNGSEEALDMDDLFDEEFADLEGEPDESAVITTKEPKQKKLSPYLSQREVKVIKNDGQLASFCRALYKSMENIGGASAAIGFDVEYCSLDVDIRTTLPAMLQLASPDPKGPVGLIWLDKFPNHGKDMIGTNSEFFSLMGNPNISKVGVGASKDARHLAAWWGITDKTYVSHYFSGMVDLEVELSDERTWGKSLQEICDTVLERYLPKVKEKHASAKKKQRKKGRKIKTSHWRCKDLTKEMKGYAADDASSSIDIWLKFQQSSNAAAACVVNKQYHDNMDHDDANTTEQEANI